MFKKSLLTTSSHAAFQFGLYVHELETACVDATFEGLASDGAYQVGAGLSNDGSSGDPVSVHPAITEAINKALPKPAPTVIIRDKVISTLHGERKRIPWWCSAQFFHVESGKAHYPQRLYMKASAVDASHPARRDAYGALVQTSLEKPADPDTLQIGKTWLDDLNQRYAPEVSIYSSAP